MTRSPYIYLREYSSNLLSLLGGEFNLRWIITLLHFLWQGCLDGLVATGLGSVLRNASASLL